VEFWFGDYRLHPTDGLRRGSSDLHVTPKSLSVLSFLVGNAGRVVAKDELIRAVWRDVAVSDSALTSCIKELRQVLRDDAKRPRFIETLNRRGFRFIASTSPAERFGDPGGAMPPPTTDHAPLVGRSEPLRRMSTMLSRASEGVRQEIFVVGEPGIGKTALVDGFLRSVTHRPDAWRVTHGQCVEHYGEAEPYQPLLDAVARLCRQPDGEPFVAALRRHAPCWLAQLPSFQTPTEFRTLERRTAGISSERMRRELMDALDAMASWAPIVICLEDVHWSDLSTLDWVAAFAARVERARLVLIATCRSAEVRAEHHPYRAMIDNLRVKGRCEELVLAGLPAADVGSLIAARFSAADGRLDRLGDLVHQHTDGNPLFVMNVLGDLVVRGVLAEQDGQWELREALGTVSFGVPEDVGRTITRQVERLNPTERRLLEAMSVLGSSCPAAAIAAATDLSTTDVESSLGALAVEHWLVGQGRPARWPDGTVSASFEFLHALYRDVASARVHPAQRAELHRRIGERLERAFDTRTDEIAAELAVHFEAAHDIPRAVLYLQRAAEISRRRSAYSIAEGQLRRAFSLLEQVPQSADRAAREAELRIALGSLLMAIRGWGSDEIETHYTRAIELCQGSESSPYTFPSLWGLWLFNWGRGDGRTAHDLATRLRVHAERAGDPRLLLQACHARWATAFSLGHFDRVCLSATEGTALYRIDQHASLASAYGNHDAGACALNFHARSLVLLGHVDEAARTSEAALALARELDHPFTMAQTLFFASTVHHERQDPAATLSTASAAVAIARDHGFRLIAAWASILEGWALARIGDRDDGLAMIRSAMPSVVQASGQFVTYFCGIVADVSLACGRHDEGLRAVDEGLSAVERTGESFYEAELYRLRGELRLAVAGAHAVASAEEDFRRACATARAQDARWLLLRATTTLARTAPHGGDRMRLLTDAIEGITEGLDLPDMRAALDVQRAISASS